MAEYYGFRPVRQQLIICRAGTSPFREIKLLLWKIPRVTEACFLHLIARAIIPKALEAALNIKNLVKFKICRAGPTLPYYFLGLLNLEMRDYSKAKDFFHRPFPANGNPVGPSTICILFTLIWPISTIF